MPQQPATKANEIQELMYVHTAAAILSCSTRQIYALIQDGHIKAVRLGKRGVRVVKDSLTVYLKQNQIDPKSYFE